MAVVDDQVTPAIEYILIATLLIVYSYVVQAAETNIFTVTGVLQGFKLSSLADVHLNTVFQSAAVRAELRKRTSQ